VDPGARLMAEQERRDAEAGGDAAGAAVASHTSSMQVRSPHPTSRLSCTILGAL
jgi:hypothetical protein